MPARPLWHPSSTEEMGRGKGFPADDDDGATAHPSAGLRASGGGRTFASPCAFCGCQSTLAVKVLWPQSELGFCALHLEAVKIRRALDAPLIPHGKGPQLPLPGSRTAALRRLSWDQPASAGSLYGQCRSQGQATVLRDSPPPPNRFSGTENYLHSQQHLIEIKLAGRFTHFCRGQNLVE